MGSTLKTDTFCVFFAFTCCLSHLNYVLIMTGLNLYRRLKLLCVFVVLLCFAGCPSPTKMTFPTPDVAKVDPGIQIDPGTLIDPGETLPDTSVEDVVADTQEADGLPSDPGSTDIAIDGSSDAEPDTQLVDASDQGMNTSDATAPVDPGGPQDPGSPADPGSPNLDTASPDAGFCDPPQCQGAPAPQWTLTDYQENPPLEKNFDSYAGKVTVVMLLAAH